MGNRKLSISVVAGLLLGAFAISAAAVRAQSSGGPIASLTAGQSTFAAGDRIVVHLTLSNSSSDPVQILRWMISPADAAGPLFVIERDGGSVEYLGIVAKRLPPGDQHFVSIAAGASETWEIDLSNDYSFAASDIYRVRYDVASGHLYGPNSPGRLVSNTLEFFAEGRVTPLVPRMRPRSVTGTTGYIGCSGAEQTSALEARNAASVYAADSYDYLNTNTVDSRYTTWFGVYDSTRYATVRTHFANIRSAIDTASPMNFDCSCTDAGTYAYVYPSAPYDIYLCGAFWSAPTSGSDSKAGTLIHETSHFTIVAGTDDFVYGQTDSQSLASSNPSQAIANADNHEYFAEEYGVVRTPTPGGPTSTPTPTVTPGGPTLTPTVTPGGPTSTPAPAAVCPSSPATCESAGKALLKIKNTGDPNKSQLLWKWGYGSIDLNVLGDPTVDTTYRLCVYDGSALLAQPQVGFEAGFNWWYTATGYKYSNPGTNSEGAFKASIKSGFGNAKILLKARGFDLGVPTLPPSLTTDLRVQFVEDSASGSACWESLFSIDSVYASDTQLKATFPW